jgi:hypothetical protein
MTKHKTALVFGGTGLVGKALLAQLKVDNRYSNVTCIGRTTPQKTLEKAINDVQFVKVDFDDLNGHLSLFKVDHVYVCLGTTMKKSGSQSAFRRVDFDYVLNIAKLSAKANVSSFVWISSVGANAVSSNFYLRVKGELEKAIYGVVELKRASCVQPSLLLGKREDSRLAESIGIMASQLISPFMFGRFAKYKPIEAECVAEQMIALQYFD